MLRSAPQAASFETPVWQGSCTAGPGCLVAWHAGYTADLQRNVPPVKWISEMGFSSIETLCWKSPAGKIPLAQAAAGSRASLGRAGKGAELPVVSNKQL